ncbi:MFS transporter [Nonomuraea sp. NPDC047529]|uniref:MFS transporter n=1 Tax=Nonomuraea sp. NPDC047529 TaxID=3155623 RepID=UPI0033EAF26F
MTTAPATTPGRSPALMLTLATLGFAVNFWAWALLSPLGPRFKELLGLSAGQQALLVAVPVIVGSLGRIPVGALTDRFGGRVMFPLVSAATIVPVLFIGLFGQTSMVSLLIGGFFLGIGGTVFAVGVPFVNAWFPPNRRGLAVGIFGAGMGGTAISALTTVPLVRAGGPAVPFLITAVVLAAYAFLTMAAALGAGSGATFALVAQVAPADKVGTVTGLVGAAGGLGGFVPPLVMGFLYGRLGSYGVGLGLLAATAVLTLALTVTAVRARAARRVAGPVASR